MDMATGRFTHGEWLLLRTIRLLALQSACHSLRCHFELACGCAGAEAYRALGVFVEQLRRSGRRRIALSPPPALDATDDELSLLAAFAAAQVDDYRALDLRLADLNASQPPAALGGAVCLVAQAFAMQGLLLRRQDAPPAAA